MLGDVVLCRFPFTSGAATKVRPALVLFNLQQDVIVCRLTSVGHSDPRSVALINWQAAGLLKPTVARLDRIVTAERSILLRQLGALSANDQDAVRQSWNQHMRL